MLMRIELTDEEQQQLLKIKQKGKSETIRDRAHAVLLRNKGFTIENTAKALLRSDKFVKSALRLFKGKKLAKTNFKGNNHKLSSEQRAETVEMIREKAPNELKDFKFKEQFWTTDILRSVLKKRYNIEYKTEKSYYGLFKAAGFSFHKPKTKDFRQDPAKMKEFKGALKKSSTTTKIRLSW